MKITDLKTAVIQGNFEWILVRVYTDEGIIGMGECWRRDHRAPHEAVVSGRRPTQH